MLRGKGFIDFPEFEQGYEALKLTTEGFQDMNPDKVMETVKEVPLALIVLRSILGFTPPEWAYIASQRMGIDVSQSFTRTLDRNIRLEPFKPLPKSDLTTQRVPMMFYKLSLSQGKKYQGPNQQLGDNDSRGTVCPILPAATTIKRNPSLPQFRSGQSLSNALEYPQSKDRHYPQLEIHSKSHI